LQKVFLYFEACFFVARRNSFKKRQATGSAEDPTRLFEQSLSHITLFFLNDSHFLNSLRMMRSPGTGCDRRQVRFCHTAALIASFVKMEQCILCAGRPPALRRCEPGRVFVYLIKIREHVVDSRPAHFCRGCIICIKCYILTQLTLFVKGVRKQLFP